MTNYGTIRSNTIGVVAIYTSGDTTIRNYAGGFIGGIRSVAAADNVIIDAKAAGKWKTAMQMVAIPLILVSYDLAGIPFTHLGELLLWVSVILSIFSGYQYDRLYFESRKTI